jgi:predicted peroxiredoxin
VRLLTDNLQENIEMTDKKKLVVVVTNGANDERSSVAWSVANGAVGSDLVCPPCAGVRGYEQDDLIDGVTLAGSVAMLDVVQQGASTLTF